MKSTTYSEKKRFFRQLLTIYGRKPVLEALSTQGVKLFRLHLSETNMDSAIIQDILHLAQQQNAEILYHTRRELSRISRNAKQDQGVAADLRCEGYGDYREFIDKPPLKNFELIALDNITNPQNLGMIIRSVCAGEIDGLLIPEKGCARLDALVMKASAGTLFKTRILRCGNLTEALSDFRSQGVRILALSSYAKRSLAQIPSPATDVDTKLQANIFVLGNETDGVSQTVQDCCDELICIPMNNQVESLNVAVTAGLLAFRRVLSGS